MPCLLVKVDGHVFFDLLWRHSIHMLRLWRSVRNSGAGLLFFKIAGGFLKLLHNFIPDLYGAMLGVHWYSLKTIPKLLKPWQSRCTYIKINKQVDSIKIYWSFVVVKCGKVQEVVLLQDTVHTVYAVMSMHLCISVLPIFFFHPLAKIMPDFNREGVWRIERVDSLIVHVSQDITHLQPLGHN